MNNCKRWHGRKYKEQGGQKLLILLFCWHKIVDFNNSIETYRSADLFIMGAQKFGDCIFMFG